jgi:hypothetical protein
MKDDVKLPGPDSAAFVEELGGLAVSWTRAARLVPARPVQMATVG